MQDTQPQSLADLIRDWAACRRSEAGSDRAIDNPSETAWKPINDRLIIGTREDDALVGTETDNIMIGWHGMDDMDGSGGDDWVFGGPDSDVLDGGAGSDKVFGSSGDDDFHFDVEQNDGSRDFYSGGRGNDTLRIDVSAATFNSAPFQDDLEAYGGRSSGWQAFRVFEFDSVGLTVHGIEEVEIYVDGVLAANAIPSDNVDPDTSEGLLERFADWLPDAWVSRFDMASATPDGGSWLS